MDWWILLLAACFEVIWALALKASVGFTRFSWSLVSVLTMLLSFGALAFSLRTLPVGTAYAIWTGLGSAGTLVAGILFFQESCHPLRILSALLILLGTFGLKWFDSH